MCLCACVCCWDNACTPPECTFEHFSIFYSNISWINFHPFGWKYFYPFMEWAFVTPLGGVVWGSFEKEECLHETRLKMGCPKVLMEGSHQPLLLYRGHFLMTSYPCPNRVLGRCQIFLKVNSGLFFQNSELTNLWRFLKSQKFLPSDVCHNTKMCGYYDIHIL